MFNISKVPMRISESGELGQKQTGSVSKNKSAEVTLYKTKMAAPMDVNKHSFLEKRS